MIEEAVHFLEHRITLAQNVLQEASKKALSTEELKHFGRPIADLASVLDVMVYEIHIAVDEMPQKSREESNP